MAEEAEERRTARELMHRFPGRMVWHGASTGTWWAYDKANGLMESKTAEELAERLSGGAPRREVLRLDGLELPPRQARARVRSAAVAWGLERLAEDAGLVVTELVTNALRHARTPIVLEVVREENRLAVLVSDGSTALPVESTPGDYGGFGLALVQGLADITVQAHASGKTIRAVLPKRV